MANTANTTAITTDFNVTPYYDDYDPSKGYYRILFKPGYAVQAREVTQMQTALQEQLARFGKNIFKDGTIILPGVFTLETDEGKPAGRGISYVKVKDFDNSNNAVSITQWNSLINSTKTSNNRLEVVGSSSNITAKVVQVLDGVQTSSNTKTLYVAYTSSSPSNSSIKAFQAGETLTANVDGSLYSVVVHDTDPEPTGKASRFSISAGVLFAKNHFIAFPDQSVIISRYDANPTARVGFTITEDIITASQDSSLLDPAQESSNFTAPGADRFQLNPVLTVVPVDEDVDVRNFVSLFTLENGLAKTFNANTQYSYINDAMARRTYDNSGDFAISGLEVQIKEHDNTGSNYGRYPDGNNQLLYIGVGAGKAYVSGYEVGMPGTFDLSTTKGTTTKSVKNQYATVTMGQYVIVNEFCGGWELNKGAAITFYNTAQKRSTGPAKAGSTGSPSGTAIGTATLLSVEYVTGTKGYDAKYKVYLADIQMTGAYTFGQVRSLYAAATGSYNSNMYADVVLSTAAATANTAVLENIPSSSLLFYTGSFSTKSIRDGDDPLLYTTNYEFNDDQGISSSVQVSTNGIFTITLTPGIEEFPYGTSTLTYNDTDDIFLTFDKLANGTFSMAANIDLGISTSGSANTTTLGGVGSNFTKLNVGDKLQLSGNSTVYTVTSIANTTSLTVDRTILGTTTAGNNIYKVYQTGDQINLAGIGGTSGVRRTITTTSTSLQFDLKELFPGNFYVTVGYPVARTTAPEIKKVLRPGRYVKINCATAGTKGPFNLGISDVYKIKSIRLGSSGSFPSSNTDLTNVTDSFTLDNGQRDTHYDHAKIKPRISLTTDSRLLVELDYFEPDYTTGAGFFCVDSYPIEDNDNLFNADTDIRTENIPVFKSASNGNSYDLRNYMDFRPVKINTAANATTPAGASTNPATTSTFDSPAAGLKFPVPSSNFQFDYYYYLGRIDVVVADKDSRFQVIQGQPSATPQVPEIPAGSMAIAQIQVSPYPSLSPAYAATLGRLDLATVQKPLLHYRYTVRDIDVLKDRINNLEYYTSLSLLEKAATDTKIKGDTGLDRFKNGIFTDNFRDDSRAATYDPEHRIVFDPEEKTIRPVYKMHTLAYKFLSGTNVKFNNPVLTCNYSEILHHEQKYATKDINVERQSWLYLGTVELFPKQDVWIDTTIMPDETLKQSGIQIVTYGSQGKVYHTGSKDYGIKPISGNAEYGMYFANNGFIANATPGVKDVLNTTTWNSWKSRVVGYKIYTGSVTGDKQPSKTVYATYDEARKAAQAINPVGGKGVTIETVYDNERTGTQYWEAQSTSSVTTGLKVINTTEYSYIRPQMIGVHCTGMKPYTRMWAYFDNVPLQGTNPTANNSRPLTARQFDYKMQQNQFGLPANTLNDLRQTGIKSITVTAGGSNYRIPPTVTITGGNGGFGATAEAVMKYTGDLPQAWNYIGPKPTPIKLYKVDQVVITNAGGNYTGSASVVFNNSGTGGSGAAATATLMNPNGTPGPTTVTDTGAYAAWGSPLVTDAGGQLDFEIRVPSGQFRVGQRVVLVADTMKYVNLGDAASAADIPPDISTGGTAVFTASGQAVTKQRTIISTAQVSYHSENIKEHFRSANFEYIAAPPPPPPASHSCTAYSFYAKAPSGEEGIFLTSIDIFVSRIGREGFWCEIREMDSGQTISRSTVPYSEVFFNNPKNVKISSNGVDNPTRIIFPAPVFLFNDTQYALVIHPKNANPDLYVWISRLGETDVNGRGRVNDRRGTGTFFQTNNNTNWDIIEGVDLTVKFYRANFTTAAATAKLGNRPIEKLFVFNNTIDFGQNQGDIFISGDHFSFSTSNCTPVIGDYAVGDISSQNSAVVNTSGGLVCVSNTGYYQGELIHFYHANGAGYKGDANVSSIFNGSGALEYYMDGPTSLVHLGQSGGGFVVGDHIICSSDWSQYGKINGIDSISQFPFSAFHFEPSVLKFKLTDISYSMNSTNYITNTRRTTDIDPSETQYFGVEQTVLSRSNEDNFLGGANSNIININMRTTSNSVSPVVDLDRTQTIILDSVLNNNITGETRPESGDLLNKYISKIITLAEGQDSEDMQVILAAYRPPGTDVKVWLKILHATDPNPFADQNWVELYKTNNGDNIFSSLEDRNNFKEYTYLVPTQAYDRLSISNTNNTTLSSINVGDTLVGRTSGFTSTVTDIEGGSIYIMNGSGFAAGETANVSNSTMVYGNTNVSATGRTVALNATVSGVSNVIAYTTDAGVTYATYKYFAIKVGLLNDGNNGAIYPRVGDLRAIALQK